MLVAGGKYAKIRLFSYPHCKCLEEKSNKIFYQNEKGYNRIED